MSEVSPGERARRLRILNALFAKTKENGASEEESAAAIAHATKLMGEWAIEDHELGFATERRTNVKRQLNLKYGNKWRWEVCNTLSFNVGVMALHWNVGNGVITYFGREHVVEAAAVLAEHIVNEIERLSKDTGLDLTGRRRFARGCAMRVRQRIRDSFDLTGDPRLPVIMKTQREQALEDYGKDKVGKKRSQHREEDSIEYIMGFRKGDQIELRMRDKQLGG